MNNKIIVVVFLLISQTMFGQIQQKLSVQMNDCKGEQFVLVRGDEGGSFVVGQEKVDDNGMLSFVWEGDYGFYRLVSDLGNIDFYLSNSDFHFSLLGKPVVGELRFPANDENNQFHYYLSEFNVLNQAIGNLRENLLTLNERDSSYKELYAEFKSVQKEKKVLLKELWRTHIDSWPARMALAQQELIPDIKLKGKKYDDYYQKHFFDYFAISDSVLQATPIYYEKIGKFLKVNHIEELIKAENYEGINDVISKLFWLTELEPSSQKYLANYLMSRYPEQKVSKIYHLIVDAYKVMNTCEYVMGNKVIQNRIQNSRANNAGWLVPNIDLYNTLDGKIQSLGEVNSDLTLLIIWSGTCVHSREMLERIKDLYPEYHEMGLEVVAVSLDSNLGYWKDMVSQNYYPWVNACDTEGLNGTTANMLSIYVTPSMFLIDPSLKTVAVPQTFFQLERELMEFFK
ncbi:hypothetical protein BZG02_14005 [Labilibaculum filiforme]|uniref:Thioredoxin domain-containing protein n=1 Tax=Labilibaculum filiforme TaxID=1940526 RepID=A0A2N3HVI5_9BACT|nr:TlpA disulfide reductase family protein [Labilibaculum filiforme]PKQ62048.1 hypothetical protein BZG02_14005 [Labilibaculum filiforme]